MAAISFNAVPAAARKSERKLLKRWQTILRRGVFLLGTETRLLTSRLTRIVGDTVIPVASGHDALLLSLASLRLTPEDEVIIPTNAYPTAFPVALSGAKLVLADVDRNGQLSLADLKRKTTARTKVVILVHLYGLIGDVIGIADFCRKRGITLIEDCAQAFGSTFRGKPAGTFGDFGCFSFYPTKNLGSFGDAGAVRTTPKYAAYIRQATSYGERSRYRSDFVAGHSQIPELQAGGLNVYLSAFPAQTRKRYRVAQWYQDFWKHYALDTVGYLLTSHKESIPVRHLLVASLPKRDTLRAYLKTRTIPTLIHYPHPVHTVPAFAGLGYAPGDFPTAEHLAATIISLPFHPFIRKSEVRTIVSAIASMYETHPL